MSDTGIPTVLEQAELDGAAAYREGQDLRAVPYRMHQGSPERIFGFAWRRGFLAAQGQAEIEEQEAAGHFRDR